MQVEIDGFAAAFDDSSRAVSRSDRLRQRVERTAHADQVGLDAADDLFPGFARAVGDYQAARSTCGIGGQRRLERRRVRRWRSGRSKGSRWCPTDTAHVLMRSRPSNTQDDVNARRAGKLRLRGSICEPAKGANDTVLRRLREPPRQEDETAPLRCRPGNRPRTAGARPAHRPAWMDDQ
jgi:hypothetical protein